MISFHADFILKNIKVCFQYIYKYLATEMERVSEIRPLERLKPILSRADSMLAPSQWETSLQSNAVSHRLGGSIESAILSLSHYYSYCRISDGICKAWTAVAMHFLSGIFRAQQHNIRLKCNIGFPLKSNYWHVTSIEVKFLALDGPMVYQYQMVIFAIFVPVTVVILNHTPGAITDTPWNLHKPL